MQRQINLRDLFKTIEMEGHPILIKMAQSRNFQQTYESFEEFKKEALLQRKVLAKKYQPRKVGDSLEKMAEINSAIDFLQKIQLQPPRPIVHEIKITFSAGSGTTATSGTGMSFTF